MSIRKLVKDGLIMKKNIEIHSRSRARRHLASKRKGFLNKLKPIIKKKKLFRKTYWHGQEKRNQRIQNATKGALDPKTTSFETFVEEISSCQEN